MKLPSLVFFKILDSTGQDDISNLREGLKNTEYAEWLEKRLDVEETHPFICHLCISDKTLLELKRLFTFPENSFFDYWNLLIDEERWDHNSVQLRANELSSLHNVDEKLIEMNGFHKSFARKFCRFMLGVESNKKPVKQSLLKILDNTRLFHGAKALIAHVEKEHKTRRNLLEVYNCILDQHNFKLNSIDIREQLDPNQIIGIKRRHTFMSIANAYLMNDMLMMPLNRHKNVQAKDLPLVALRDLFTKTIECYERLILFKPPYEATNQFTDEYQRERIRIAHFKTDLAFFHNCKIILDHFLPYKY